VSGWIKFDKEMSEDPRLVDAASTLLAGYVFATRTPGGGRDLSRSDALRLACNALRGAIVTLWCYADTHVRDDDTLPCDADSLDAIVGLEGFCDALPSDWVTVGDDRSVTLPGYCAKNSLISRRKKADKGAERQKRYRERLRASQQRNETRNETRNGESNGAGNDRVTEGGDLDLDLEVRKKDSLRSSKERLGYRLRDDFDLTPERRAIAVDEKLDPQRTFAQFTDHWRASSGANARKRDWDAAWRNWCRNAHDRNGGNGHAARQQNTQRKPSAVERVYAATAHVVGDSGSAGVEVDGGTLRPGLPDGLRR
jgi:hypothetical protein